MSRKTPLYGIAVVLTLLFVAPPAAADPPAGWLVTCDLSGDLKKSWTAFVAEPQQIHLVIRKCHEQGGSTSVQPIRKKK